jgi:hypothetical protein
VPVFFRGLPTDEFVSGQSRRYVFEVGAVHKGVAAARVIVATPLHGSACGVRFPLNQEVLVGAYPSDDVLRVNQCTQFCIGQKREELERLLRRCTPGTACPPEG